MSNGILILRLAVGTVFAAHGLQKLTGAFGGPGLKGVEGMMESLDQRPPALQARAVALTETLGGVALATGTATPFAAAGLVAAMTTAIRTVHRKNGFFNSKGGYEFNGVLIAAVTAIAADGPGAVSIDALSGHRKWGIGAAIGALAAGVAASFIVEHAGKAVADVIEPRPAPGSGEVADATAPGE